MMIQDDIIDILTSTKMDKEAKSWRQMYKVEEEAPQKLENNGFLLSKCSPTKISISPLTCGKPANLTIYDELIGITQRFANPPIIIPDFDAIEHFIRETDEPNEFVEQELEITLKLLQSEQNSMQMYGTIGNFFRIKGDTKQAIECFRKVLAENPNDPEILFNLAEVLHKMQFIDDAIYLIKRSIEYNPHRILPWRQYFTLGKILKDHGHFHESYLHLKHALSLHPNHEPIVRLLIEIDDMNKLSPLQLSTICIIVVLIIGVVVLLLFSDVRLFRNNKPKEGRNGGHRNHSRFHRGRRN
ncbi:hypothetical protein ACFFRR_002433 [Megaselia abdita]